MSAENPENGAGPPPGDQGRAGKIARAIGQALAVFLAIIVLVGVPVALILAAIFAFPTELPHVHGFVDAIFANKVVLWAARLIVLFGGVVLVIGEVYIAISIGMWMHEQRWLTQIGPFKVEEKRAIADLTAEVETWQTIAADAEEDRESLEERLTESDEVIQHLLERLGEQEDELAQLREGLSE